MGCGTVPINLGVSFLATWPLDVPKCAGAGCKGPARGTYGPYRLMELGSGKRTSTSTRLGSRVCVVWSLRATSGTAVHLSSRFLGRCRVTFQPVNREASCGSEVSRVTTGGMSQPMMYWDDYCEVGDLQALWSDPGVKAEWVMAGQKPGHKVRVSRNAAGQHYVTEVEMRALADITISRHFSGLDPVVICAIADVESNRLPLAYRYELSVKEASTGLMQTLQSTAEWLANEMGYRAYGVHQALQSLYRPFVSVYFGAAYVKWLSTYGGKRRNEEFVVRGYNGGPKGATRHYTLAYWNKYVLAKQHWTCAAPIVTVKLDTLTVPKPPVIAHSRYNPTGSSAATPASGPAWTYWDDKASAEDMEELWTHTEVRIEWEKAGERRGKVRFSRDKRLRPYVTHTELKAVASIIVRRHFQHKSVKPDMLCRLAEISSNRLLYGSGSGGGIMQITLSTALWLYRDMGYRFYRFECEGDLSKPFVCLYFGAAYVSWLSRYQGRDQDDEFVVRAYHGGPRAADKRETESFWMKFLGTEAVHPEAR